MVAIYPFLSSILMAQESRNIGPATQITAASAKVEQHLESNKLPLPSFSAYSPGNMEIGSDDVESARLALADASVELLDLVRESKACLQPWETQPLCTLNCAKRMP